MFSLDLQGVVAADRAGGGLDRVGGPGQRAERLDRARALERPGDQRAAGDEVDELAEERPLAVLGVVRLGDLAVERAQLQRDELQALALDAGDHLADEAAATPSGLTRTRVRSDTDLL